MAGNNCRWGWGAVTAMYACWSMGPCWRRRAWTGCWGSIRRRACCAARREYRCSRFWILLCRTGFFLPVTPGTKYVTVGGAIANDIHGKNHHVAGAFGRHVLRFELVRSDGSRFVCSPIENPEWFAATIGGMGLTGLMTWAEIRLRPIVSRKIDYRGDKFHGIDEFFALSQAAKSEYTVAWIDCVSTGKNFARGIFMQGDHAQTPGPLTKSKEPKLVFPIDLPEIALNRFSMAAFNSLYFHKQLGQTKDWAGGLRAVLLSAGRGAALEPDVREERAAAVPECAAPCQRA